jgi:hypothetical protein
VKAEFRAMTKKERIRDSVAVIASTMPSVR